MKLAGGILSLGLGGALIWWAAWTGGAAGPQRLLDGEDSCSRKPCFHYVRTATYSCAGQSHTVKEYRHDSTGLQFVLLPGGSLQKPAGDNQPITSVTVEPFLVAKTEVQQRVWTSVMGGNPARHKGESLPVDSVSWVQAQAFCRKTKLSLPTELEWEYACRGGTTGLYFWGERMDPEYCWLEVNADELTRPVATRRPNAFGLHDMIGNVYEWCDSWFHSEGMSYTHEGDRPRSGEKPLRVLRGGCAASPGCCAFSSSRSGNWPAKTTPYDGFRPIARLAAAQLIGEERQE